MAEHIVARALRAEAAEIRTLMEGEQEAQFRDVMRWTATRFEKLADKLHGIEKQPVFDAYGMAGLLVDPQAFSRIKLEHGNATLTIKADRIERAAQKAYQRMAASAAVLVAQQWRENRPEPVDWEHLNERDRQSWRLAVSDALRAALEPDNG